MSEPLFTSLIDLAAERLGGKALLCSDDFFARKENLLKPGRGIFIPDKYTSRGKWMDGWESRRKRTPGHDWCIIRLATPGKIHGVDIDTNHFLGNHPPFASIEAAALDPGKLIKAKKLDWKEILPKSPLEPGSRNLFEITDKNIFRILRLNIFPDGGVARLKVYGEVFKDWADADAKDEVDLAAAVNGAKAVLCNDMFFSHMDNLIMPHRGVNMGDGWETRRRRGPGFDWIIVKLGVPGKIKKIEVDTAHFKGNFPHQFSLEANFVQKDLNPVIALGWAELLPKNLLQADHVHEFALPESASQTVYNYVKLCIYPDGGVSRLRVWGTPADK